MYTLLQLKKNVFKLYLSDLYVQSTRIKLQEQKRVSNRSQTALTIKEIVDKLYFIKMENSKSLPLRVRRPQAEVSARPVKQRPCGRMAKESSKPVEKRRLKRGKEEKPGTGVHRYGTNKATSPWRQTGHPSPGGADAGRVCAWGQRHAPGSRRLPAPRGTWNLSSRGPS